jgi:two-component system, OmpR family, sensor kinase
VRFNTLARNLLVGPDGWIVVGAPLDQLPGVADESVAATLARLIDGLRQRQASQEVEIDTAPPSAPHRTLHFGVSPLREDGSGIIVIRDVTELRALDRLRAQVLRVASHDLQSPLTAINGRGQLLLKSLDDDTRPPMEQIKKDVSSMVQQTGRLSEMLHILLDLSQLAGDGRLELKRRPTDVTAMVAEVVDGLQAVSRDHNFVINMPASLIGDWDAPRLRQVIHNLISNAVKYSPEGGRVDIHGRLDDLQLRLDVIDEGIGLSPEDIGRVFDQYYRASQARALEGSGLGLFICQAIISAHGGRVWATSPGPGQGSTFSFVIPVESD